MKFSTYQAARYDFKNPQFELTSWLNYQNYEIMYKNSPEILK